MAYNMGVPQHKNIAEGDGMMASQDFGCKPMDHSKGPLMTPISDGMKSHTNDGDKRGAPPPVKHTRGKLSAQANADHGPHMGRMNNGNMT